PRPVITLGTGILAALVDVIVLTSSFLSTDQGQPSYQRELGSASGKTGSGRPRWCVEPDPGVDQVLREHPLDQNGEVLHDARQVAEPYACVDAPSFTYRRSSSDLADTRPPHMDPDLDRQSVYPPVTSRYTSDTEGRFIRCDTPPGFCEVRLDCHEFGWTSGEDVV